MNNIIEDMLDLSAMDMKQLGLVLQKFSLQKNIELVITQLQPAVAERQQVIETQNLDALPLIEGDARRIHQVIRQLVNNAIKYTPDGGRITITGRTLNPSADKAGQVKIAISDTGVGIAPEDKEKIFEKFYRSGNSSLHSSGQTKFMGAGPGLGLAIVKGLIEAHGGQVSADSPGFDMQNCPGSTFTVILPIKANPSPDVHTQWLEPKARTKTDVADAHSKSTKKEEEISL
jgi:hypothetical protein